MIAISTCDFFFNNDILIKNVLPIQKEEAMIRIFAYAFYYGNIFCKVKQALTRIRKKNLEWK